MSNLGSSVLAIDTASHRASIALAREGRVVGVFGVESMHPQSVELWDNVDVTLGRLGLTIRDVTSFAVTRGPGSFTGLRVGLTAALGFGRALGRPVYGATTLEVAARAGGASVRTCAAFEAHRREVYAQEFAVSAEGDVVARTEPIVAPLERIASGFGPGPIRLVGDGAVLYGEELDRAALAAGASVDRPAVAAPLGSGWQVAPIEPFLAGELARMASRWEREGREPGDVDALYVRPSEAEVNLGRAGRGQTP